MQIKNIFITAVALLSSIATFAQENRKDIVFKAMKDEAARTKSISMTGMPSPFLVNYYLRDARNIRITSSYGSTVSVDLNDHSAHLGADLFIGSPKMSNRLAYDGAVSSITTTIDDNELAIRTSFWTLSDVLYKNSIQYLRNKESHLGKLTLSPEEAELADFLPTPIVTDRGSDISPLIFDEQKWVDMCNKLSSIFTEYENILSPKVIYTASDYIYYTYNTDGLELCQPLQYVNLSVSTRIQTEEGVFIEKNYVVSASNDADLPTYDELAKKVTELAKEMNELSDIKSIDDYYSGPVMFVDGAAQSILASNLNSFYAYRNLSQKSLDFNALERRMGKKVIDSRISIKNYTSVKEYKGKKLLGYYTMDCNGVTPERELTLVENGILKNLLSGDTETPLIKKSTGSMRLAQSGNNPIAKVMSPGTIHFDVEKGSKESAMRKELFKLAKEEGNDFAYIVKSFGSNPEVYKIDIKSGEMTRVTSVKINGVDFASLKRMAAVSSEENVSNTLYKGVPATFITPKSFILNDIELDINKNTKSPKPLLSSPKTR